MSAEHRRQLLAFFIVALAAFLLIGNGLQQQFGTRNGHVRAPAAIAAGPTAPGGPTIVPDRSRLEPGGSARGTTVTEPAPVPNTPTTSTPFTPGPFTSGPATSASAASPSRAAPGHSDRARRAERAGHRSESAAQKQATQRSARTGSDDTVAGRTATSDKKAHAKKHGKKHGKKGQKGTKGHQHHRHGR